MSATFSFFNAALLRALPTPTPSDGPLHCQCYPTITPTTTIGSRPLHGDPNVGANDAASLWEAFVHLSFTVSLDCLYLCERQEPQLMHATLLSTGESDKYSAIYN